MYLKIAQKPELKRWKHTHKKQEIKQRPKHARHKIDPTKPILPTQNKNLQHPYKISSFTKILQTTPKTVQFPPHQHRHNKQQQKNVQHLQIGDLEILAGIKKRTHPQTKKILQKRKKKSAKVRTLIEEEEEGEGEEAWKQQRKGKKFSK